MIKQSNDERQQILLLSCGSFFSCVVSSDLEPCSQLENNGPHAHITNKRYPDNEEKVET